HRSGFSGQSIHKVKYLLTKLGNIWDTYALLLGYNLYLPKHKLIVFTGFTVGCYVVHNHIIQIIKRLTIEYSAMNKFAIFFLLIVNLTVAQQYDLRFKTIDNKVGLSSKRITAVLQDSDGILWMGNRIAVDRYDGDKAI